MCLERLVCLERTALQFDVRAMHVHEVSKSFEKTVVFTISHYAGRKSLCSPDETNWYMLWHNIHKPLLEAQSKAWGQNVQ